MTCGLINSIDVVDLFKSNLNFMILNKLYLPSPVQNKYECVSRQLTASPIVRRGNILRSAASLLAAIGKDFHSFT